VGPTRLGYVDIPRFKRVISISHKAVVGLAKAQVAISTMKNQDPQNPQKLRNYSPQDK
jgi:hypothetical protein